MKKAGTDVDEGAPEAVEARLNEMERKLDRLRALYESFFMGIERTPPGVPRRELNRLFVESQQIHIRNASLRFRFQSLLQKWILLTTYWNRTIREIEAGTYRRDFAKAQRYLAQRGGAITETDAIALGIPASRAKAFVKHQEGMRMRRTQSLPIVTDETLGPVPVEAVSVPSGPMPLPLPVPMVAPGARVERPVAPLPGVSEEALSSFYTRYVDAHVRTGAAPKLTKEQLRARLSQEIPRILSEKKCASVDLDVEVDAGKVRLKARPVRT